MLHVSQQNVSVNSVCSYLGVKLRQLFFIEVSLGVDASFITELKHKNRQSADFLAHIQHDSTLVNKTVCKCIAGSADQSRNLKICIHICMHIQNPRVQLCGFAVVVTSLKTDIVHLAPTGGMKVYSNTSNQILLHICRWLEAFMDLPQRECSTKSCVKTIDYWEAAWPVTDDLSFLATVTTSKIMKIFFFSHVCTHLSAWCWH